MLRSKDDILYFLQKVIGRQELSVKDIRILCAHSPGYHQLDCDALLFYCLHFRLIVRNEGVVSICKDIEACLFCDDELNEYIVVRTINQLFKEQVLQDEMFYFDEKCNRFAFRNDLLPLKAASIRNVLISQGFFDLYRSSTGTTIYINSYYETIVSTLCRNRKRRYSLEMLKKKLEKNSIAGAKAEQYVLEFEKKRLRNHVSVNQIRIVSDIDVCAGYDIISFCTEESDSYDRFIEVKAVTHNLSFHLSINELETSKLKGETYYLYLVELNHTYESSYTPIIIRNPYKTVYCSEEWILEADSFSVWHI